MVEESLSPAAITDNLDTRFIGQNVIYYPCLDSTMLVAGREARWGTAEGTVVITDEQTAGRGRLKRRWLTPKGNIALSIILYPSQRHLPYLIMLASLAVVRSIEAVTGLRTQIKWPNDLLINGKKVCGILVESDVGATAVAYAIIGIGINVRLNLDDFPEIAATATSLAGEMGGEISRVELVRCLLTELERLYLSIPSGDSVYQEWRDRLVTLGRRVRVKSGKSVLDGVAESVARDGSLRLRQADGSLATVIAGDITLSDHE